MKKRILLLLLLCAAAVLAVTASAAGTGAEPGQSTEPEARLMDANVIYPVEGGNLYFDATSGTIEKSDKTVTKVDIPSEIYGISVKHLNTWCFQNCTDLISVTIPDSIKTVNSNVFSGCTKLTSVTIPGSLTSLSSSMFSGCIALTTVMIPASVTSIGTWAFQNCTALKDVYYEGTLQQWLAVRVNDYNDPLLKANVHYESELPTPSVQTVRVNSVTISDTSGNPLYAIPRGTFHATVSVTSLSSLDDAMVFFSAYTPAGQFVSMQYAFVEASPGATVKVTLPFDNADGKIGEIRAVAAELRSLVPLAASSSAIYTSSDQAW